MKINAQINSQLEGKFKLAIVQADGSLRHPIGEGWHKNLILNSGVDLFFSLGAYACPQIMDFCRAGTGSTAALATDTALQAQVRFSSTYNAGAGNNSTTFNLGTGAAIFQRVYEFATEVGTVVYRELGISNTSAGNLFSRIAPLSAITVNAGENLRVTYALTLTVPQLITATTVALAASGTFNPAGQIKFVGEFINMFPRINASGNPEAIGFLTDTTRVTQYNGSLEAVLVPFSSTGTMVCSLRTASAFPAVNVSLSASTRLAFIDTTAAGAVNTPYVPGTFTKTGTYSFAASNPGSTITTIRSILVARFSNAVDLTATQGIMLLLDSNQTKNADFRLTLTFRWTVTRP